MNRRLWGATILVGWVILFAVPALYVASIQTVVEPDPSPEPTKFARFEPPPTTTPTNTPLPTRTSTVTRTPTASGTPTFTRTLTPVPKPSVTSTPTLEPVSVGETYGLLSVPSVEPIAVAQLNLSVRGYVATQAMLGFVDYTGPFDAGAPQLFRLFMDDRTPNWASAYQLHAWDNLCNCRGALESEPPVTLLGARVTPGEILRLPRSSYHIAQDYQALVLYAEPERITVNYTREADPIRGYSLYLEGIAVDSTLLGLYKRLNGAGRHELPALRAGQGMGRARGNELKIAIRDAGAFMDPRSRKDWWRGK